MRPDVRIRIRGGVIRVRIGETVIRTVIRITAEQHATRMTHLYSVSLSLCRSSLRSFKEEPVTAASERHTAGKGVHLLNLLTDV